MDSELRVMRRLNGDAGALLGVYQDSEITKVLRMPTLSLIELTGQEENIAKQLGKATGISIEEGEK